MDEDSGGGGECDCDDNEAEDEESGLFPGFLGGPRDAEGVDEGIGEKVEEFHSKYYALRLSMTASKALHRRCGA